MLLLFCKPARLLVAFSAAVGVLSGLALLLIKETVFLLSVYRQASQLGHLGNTCVCLVLDSSEQDPAPHECESPFARGLRCGLVVWDLCFSEFRVCA